MYVVFLKITTFLWRILILHPGRTSLLLETVTIKFGGLRGRGAEGRGPTYGAEGRGPRKTNTPIINLLLFSCQNYHKT